MPTISIFFCGDCNPRIDSAGLSRKVAVGLAGAGCEINYYDDTADCCVLINGCPATCIARGRHFSMNHVVVAGGSVDGIGMDERDLPDAVNIKVLDYLGEEPK